MKQRRLKYQKLITFSRWSRKKYAVLASLGKQIKIGNVRLEICQLALLRSEKSQLQDISVGTNNVEEESPDDIVSAMPFEVNATSAVASSEYSEHLHISNILHNYNHQVVLSFIILLYLEALLFVSGVKVMLSRLVGISIY